MNIVMRLDPEDYKIPTEYRHWRGDEAEDFLGPFFFKAVDNVFHTAFRVEQRHCNSRNTLHGGITMAFSDYTLCLSAKGNPDQRVATVSCNNEFIAPAYKGDLVLGRSELIKRSRSLVFVRAELRVEEKIIMISSAVVKPLE